MAPLRFGTTVLAVLVATPALAHPGHGVPGWLHHGEAGVLAAVVIGGIVAWGRVSGSGPRGDS